MSFLNDVWTNRDHRFSSAKPNDRVLGNRSRSARFAASAIKELCRIAFAIIIFSTIMALLATLDIWIWVPHAGLSSQTSVEKSKGGN
jgi:hypothetical protein